MKRVKTDKGQAGLTILLSVITMLFVIGLLIMIFVLMGGALQDSDSLYNTESDSIVNETLTSVNESGENFSLVDYREIVCTITVVHNASNGAVINSANYTQTNCHLNNATVTFGGFDWNVSYSYTYERSSGGPEVINATTTSIGTSTDWFPLFIVITAMVVLILLTVIIITAIRSSGLMGGTQGNTNVGKTGHA